MQIIALHTYWTCLYRCNVPQNLLQWSPTLNGNNVIVIAAAAVIIPFTVMDFGSTYTNSNHSGTIANPNYNPSLHRSHEEDPRPHTLVTSIIIILLENMICKFVAIFKPFLPVRHADWVTAIQLRNRLPTIRVTQRTDLEIMYTFSCYARAHWLWLEKLQQLRVRAYGRSGAKLLLKLFSASTHHHRTRLELGAIIRIIWHSPGSGVRRSGSVGEIN